MPGSSLRIGLLTHSVNPRGGVVHTLELARALHAAGHAVTVMAPVTPGQRLFRNVPCAVDLVRVTGHPGGTRQMIESRIDAYVAHLTAARCTGRVADQFDVLHAQDGIGGNALETLRQESVIGGFVLTVHHVDPFGDARIDAMQVRAIRGAGRVVCVSRLWRDALETDHGIRATVIDNGVDRRRFSPDAREGDAQIGPRLGLRTGGPLVVSVGGIERRKNTVRIVQAFARLRCALPNAQLALVGGASLLDHSGYRQEFDTAIAAAGLRVGAGADVVITGTVADHELPAVLRLADAVAFPSLNEGFGLVVLEALASGTPTVVSNIAPFNEYLGRGDVHWADPMDAGSIAAALIEAVGRAKFQPPAVCRRFEWGASAARHAALYYEFLDSADMRLH